MIKIPLTQAEGSQNFKAKVFLGNVYSCPSAIVFIHAEEVQGQDVFGKCPSAIVCRGRFFPTFSVANSVLAQAGGILNFFC